MPDTNRRNSLLWFLFNNDRPVHIIAFLLPIPPHITSRCLWDRARRYIRSQLDRRNPLPLYGMNIFDVEQHTNTVSGVVARAPLAYIQCACLTWSMFQFCSPSPVHQYHRNHQLASLSVTVGSRWVYPLALPHVRWGCSAEDAGDAALALHKNGYDDILKSRPLAMDSVA